MRKDGDVVDWEVSRRFVFWVVAKLIAALAESLFVAVKFLAGEIADFIGILILKDRAASIAALDSYLSGHTAVFIFVEKHTCPPLFVLFSFEQVEEV